MPYLSDQTFFCHDGMPRAVYWVHPSGVVRRAEPGDYQPTIDGGRPWQADGSPAVVCAGWAADSHRMELAASIRRIKKDKSNG